MPASCNCFISCLFMSLPVFLLVYSFSFVRTGHIITLCYFFHFAFILVGGFLLSCMHIAIVT